jgi:hypothetical protein
MRAPFPGALGNWEATNMGLQEAHAARLEGWSLPHQLGPLALPKHFIRKSITLLFSLTIFQSNFIKVPKTISNTPEYSKAT